MKETADALYIDTENSAMTPYVAVERNQRCGSEQRVRDVCKDGRGLSHDDGEFGRCNA